MGTRSLTRVIEDGRHFVNMYSQFDGYPSGHGADLAKFISGKPIVNGYQSSDQAAFNGAGCLAASIVANFKDGIGGIYLYPAESTDCGQDYEYILTVTELKLSVKVVSYEKTEFEGSAEDFALWCSADHQES